MPLPARTSIQWPARTAICIDCRTALPANTACPGGHQHRVTRLDTEDGREQLLVAAWGPRPLRQRLLAASKAGAAGASGGTFAQACSGCDLIGEDIRVVLVFLVLFAVIAGVWFLAGYIRDRMHLRRLGRLARGATLPAASCGAPTEQVGVIVSAAAADDPISRTRCVAFSTVLDRYGKVMLRDATTIGFDVELTTGETVRIPPGPCVIEVPADATARPQDLDGYRRALDPLRDGREIVPGPQLSSVRKARRLVNADLEPFPADRVGLVTLAAGQRVEIASELEPMAATGETGYREAHHVLVPRGVVRLRPC
jgi:hypothetical protein